MNYEGIIPLTHWEKLQLVNSNKVNLGSGISRLWKYLFMNIVGKFCSWIWMHNISTKDCKPLDWASLLCTLLCHRRRWRRLDQDKRRMWKWFQGSKRWGSALIPRCPSWRRLGSCWRRGRSVCAYVTRAAPSAAKRLSPAPWATGTPSRCPRNQSRCIPSRTSKFLMKYESLLTNGVLVQLVSHSRFIHLL